LFSNATSEEHAKHLAETRFSEQQAEKGLSMAYQSINPFDNHLEKTFDEISDTQLEAKLAAAASCFVTWKQTSYAHRAKIVARAAVLLHEQAERFAQIMTMEMGKRIAEARGEVEFSSQILTNSSAPLPCSSV
jgi:acyl-CoA reductase-like NAD-dependent aldehyde dehydrogenase